MSISSVLQKLSIIAAGVTVMGLGTVNQAQAALITSSSDQALSGGQTIDFESAKSGAYSSITQGNVTFSTLADQVGFISSAYGGDYNTQGQSFQNTYALNGFADLKFSFSTAINAFGFNFGASDVPWTLTAFDVTGSVLDTQVLAPTQTSNSGNFFGIKTGGSLISYATLSSQSDTDYVFVDNFKSACL
jgi:hypothetical protein